jgi:hypothetical protein
MFREILAAVLAAALMPGGLWGGQARTPASRQLDLTWEELAGFLVERQISLALTDGTKLQGEVLAVRSDSLVMDVRKSSRKPAFPTGQTEVARASVGDLRIIREGHAIMRVAGAIGGGIGAFFGVAWIAFAAETAAIAIPALLLLVPAASAGGYYAGKLADRRFTQISIRPSVPVAGEE